MNQSIMLFLPKKAPNFDAFLLHLYIPREPPWCINAMQVPNVWTKIFAVTIIKETELLYHQNIYKLAGNSCLYWDWKLKVPIFCSNNLFITLGTRNISFSWFHAAWLHRFLFNSVAETLLSLHSLNFPTIYPLPVCILVRVDSSPLYQHLLFLLISFMYFIYKLQWDVDNIWQWLPYGLLVCSQMILQLDHLWVEHVLYIIYGSQQANKGFSSNPSFWALAMLHVFNKCLPLLA